MAALEARLIGTEALRQRLEEGDARAGGQIGVAAEDFARQRHPGGLAAARQKILAKLDQIGGAPLRRFRAGHAVRSSSPRPRSAMRLQQLAKEGRVHARFLSMPAP